MTKHIALYGDATCDGTGQCVDYPPPPLDDGNPCTNDVCDSVTGVVSHPALSDGSACMPANLCVNDTCHSGACVHGDPVVVADDDTCTLDTCSPTEGPIHQACSTLDRTVSTVLADAASFLFSSTAPIQTGVAASAIQASTFAVVRTHVYDHTSAALPGVTVTVLDHPELGTTVTQADGTLDMAVNGGQTLRLHFALSGYLPADRTIRVPAKDYVTIDDVLIPVVIQTIAGTGSGGAANGDGGAATAAVVSSPTSVAVDGAGSVYVSDGQSCVRRVDEMGVIHPFAGQCSLPGFSGDGQAATSAALNGPTDITFGSDGSLYIADTQNHRVRTVTRDGIIHTVAGSGSIGAGSGSFSGDGGAALLATLSSPSGVDVGIDGVVYIADTGNGRIRSLTPDGVIRTVAGNGGSASTGNYGPAAAASLGGPTRVRVGPDGSIFIAEQSGNMVRRVARGGLIYPVAGDGTPGYFGDGGVAANSLLKGPTDLAVRADGALLIVDQNNTVRLVNSSGAIGTLVGSATSSAYGGDNSLAALATFGPAQGIRVAEDGTVYLACTNDNRVRRIAPMLTGFAGGTSVVKFPSLDAQQLYVFDQNGRHLQTTNALTGAVVFEFAYDSSGRLSEVTDVDANGTLFNHDVTGKPTTIFAPFRQTTTLHVNDTGYLDTVTDPDSSVTSFTYDSKGLMATKTDANNGVSHYYYDSLGRLKEDDDAAGGFKKLTRVESTNGFTVTSTSALSHASSFNTAAAADGTFSRLNTSPTGLASTLKYTQSGLVTTVTPDKVTTSTAQSADPRYGMLAPTVSTTVTMPPSGTVDLAPVRTQSTSRSVTLQPNGQLATMAETTNINGQPWSRTFDATTRTWTSTSPVGRYTTTVIDDAGRVTDFTIPGVSKRSTAFDAYGRLGSITQGVRGQSFSYFDTSDISNGYLSSATDALTQQTTFTRDAFGRALSATVGTDVTGIGWDPIGNLASVTPPGQPEHDFSYTPVNLLDKYAPPTLASFTHPETKYEYDLDRHLTKVTRPDGVALDYAYDDFGRLYTVTTADSTVTTTYYDTACGTTVGCAQGRVKNVTASGDNVALDFNYDGSLLTRAQWSGAISGGVSWAFNNDLRVSKEVVNGAGGTSTMLFGYDNDGLLTCTSPTSCSPAGADAMTLGWSSTNGLLGSDTLKTVSRSLTYNGFGEMATDTASTGTTLLASETYDDSTHPRDGLGRILRKVEKLAQTLTPGSYDTYTTDYTYDSRNRLHTADTGGQTTTYEYDPNGNRHSVTNAARTIIPTYDYQDRLNTYGDYSYTYTNDGELETKTKTSDSSLTSYQYDAFGNLKRVDLPNGDVIEYLVDGKNRRVGKKKNGVLVKAWLYKDQLHPVEELDGSLNLSKLFVYATGKNSPDFMVQGGVYYRILSDQVGSPRLVVNATTGAIAQRIRHDEFGNVLEDSNAGLTPFGFAGGLYDPDTGLVRFGARDYDPSVGRWISKDPILFRGRQTNLYVYVNNDPVNHQDPRGLTVYACQEKDWSKYWTAYYGFSHAYIRTDSNAFGLYPSGPPYFDPAQIADDSSSEGECVPIPDVDDPCVDGFARSGANWGPYGLSNNCGTFVADVLNVCRSSPSMPFDGGEGGPGNVPDSPYPPGGY